MKLVILITGVKQSGKSTIAEIIPGQHEIISFADPLKLFMINVLGLQWHNVYGTEDQKNELTHLHYAREQLSGRRAMQIFGTDMVRALDPNAWIRAFVKRAKESVYNVIAAPDCRFPNEYEINDPSFVVKRICTHRQGGTDSHISETGILEMMRDRDFDLRIPNGLTIEETRKLVIEYVQHWKDELWIS